MSGAAPTSGKPAESGPPDSTPRANGGRSLPTSRAPSRKQLVANKSSRRSLAKKSSSQRSLASEAPSEGPGRSAASDAANGAAEERDGDAILIKGLKKEKLGEKDQAWAQDVDGLDELEAAYDEHRERRKPLSTNGRAILRHRTASKPSLLRALSAKVTQNVRDLIVEGGVADDDPEAEHTKRSKRNVRTVRGASKALARLKAAFSAKQLLVAAKKLEEDMANAEKEGYLDERKGKRDGMGIVRTPSMRQKLGQMKKGGELREEDGGGGGEAQGPVRRAEEGHGALHAGGRERGERRHSPPPHGHPAHQAGRPAGQARRRVQQAPEAAERGREGLRAAAAREHACEGERGGRDPEERAHVAGHPQAAAVGGGEGREAPQVPRVPQGPGAKAGGGGPAPRGAGQEGRGEGGGRLQAAGAPDGGADEAHCAERLQAEDEEQRAGHRAAGRGRVPGRRRGGRVPGERGGQRPAEPEPDADAVAGRGPSQPAAARRAGQERPAHAQQLRGPFDELPRRGGGQARGGQPPQHVPAGAAGAPGRGGGGRHGHGLRGGQQGPGDAAEGRDADAAGPGRRAGARVGARGFFPRRARAQLGHPVGRALPGALPEELRGRGAVLGRPPRIERPQRALPGGACLGRQPPLGGPQQRAGHGGAGGARGLGRGGGRGRHSELPAWGSGEGRGGETPPSSRPAKDWIHQAKQRRNPWTEQGAAGRVAAFTVGTPGWRAWGAALAQGQRPPTASNLQAPDAPGEAESHDFEPQQRRWPADFPCREDAVRHDSVWNHGQPDGEVTRRCLLMVSSLRIPSVWCRVTAW